MFLKREDLDTERGIGNICLVGGYFKGYGCRVNLVFGILVWMNGWVELEVLVGLDY